MKTILLGLSLLFTVSVTVHAETVVTYVDEYTASVEIIETVEYRGEPAKITRTKEYTLAEVKAKITYRNTLISGLTLRLAAQEAEKAKWEDIKLEMENDGIIEESKIEGTTEVVTVIE